MNKKLVTLLLILIFLNPVFAVINEAHMDIYAVTSEGDGLSADLTIEITPGNGKIWTSVEPLMGVSTQRSEITAVNLAKKITTNAKDHDYKFRIRSEASLVEGPSSGAAMALMLLSMLKDQKLSSDVTITGTISEEGFIGQVGGVFEKAGAVANDGKKLFLIPKGEAKQVVKLEEGVKSINLLEYGPRELGLKIVEVGNIEDALKLAFSNLEEIEVDVNKSLEIPDFVPTPINISTDLKPLAELTKDSIAETEIILNDAELSVYQTNFDNPDLLADLIITLNHAKDDLKNAKLAYDQNYLYSAANFAFLARVSGFMIRDVSDDPELADPQKSILDVKISTLKEDIENFKADFVDYIPVDYLEWYISAQERLLWADLSLDELRTSQEVIMDVPENKIHVAPLRDLYKYESARAWFNIAEDFYDFTKKSERKAAVKPVFEETIDDFTQKTYKGLNVLSDLEGLESITRRFESSKQALKEGWYLSSFYDVASSLSLINSELLTKKTTDLNELYTILEGKIVELEGEINKSNYSHIWPRLYLDHSKYYLQEANFYYEQNMGAETKKSLSSGIGLIFLAEALFYVSKDIYNHYERLPETEFVKVNGLTEITTERIVTVEKYLPQEVIFLVAVAAILVSVLVIFALFNLLKKFHEEHLTLGLRINEIKSLQSRMDELFAQGKIDKDQHEELTKKYSSELEELESLRQEEVTNLLEMEEARAELLAVKYLKRDVKKLLREKMINPEKAEKLFKEYDEKIEKLTDRIKQEDLELLLDKAKFMKYKEKMLRTPSGKTSTDSKKTKSKSKWGYKKKKK